MPTGSAIIGAGTTGELSAPRVALGYWCHPIIVGILARGGIARTLTADAGLPGRLDTVAIMPVSSS